MASPQKWFTDAHVALYRALGGRLVGRFGRAPMLLLTTTGRKSGQPRTLPLVYIPGEPPLVIASNGGAARHPQWYANLLSDPHAEVRIGAVSRRVVARTLEGDEREEGWRRAVAIYGPYASYQRRTERQIPVVALDSGV